MNRTAPSDSKRSAVPLQQASAIWAGEPGYGGSSSAWESFDRAIDEQLQQLEQKYRIVRSANSSRGVSAVE